jgi:preprotein translocase subunit SecY
MGDRPWPVEVIIFLLLFGIIASVIFITQGARKIPVQYAKRQVGRKVYGGTTQYIPLRVNTAGVMPITYFYTAIIFNPKDMADNMKKQGGFIPGIRPGKPTSEYIDTILTRITLPGSLLLALIAIMPTFASNIFGVTTSFASFFGGTSLLIMVGVVLDTLQQIESYLLMRHYDGFMKSGKMKGRVGSGGF